LDKIILPALILCLTHFTEYYKPAMHHSLFSSVQRVHISYLFINVVIAYQLAQL